MKKLLLLDELLDEEIGHICALNGEISKKNPLTKHHIVPVRLGGKTTLENLIHLCRLQHDIYNIIENNNKRQAEEITDYFYYLKQTRDLLVIYQMATYALDIVTKELGYKICDKGTLLTLVRQ